MPPPATSEDGEVAAAASKTSTSAAESSSAPPTTPSLSLPTLSAPAAVSSVPPATEASPSSAQLAEAAASRSAPTVDPAAPAAVPSNVEMLASMLEDCSAEASERVIAVLGPRLDALGRLAVNLQLEPQIRGDRRVRSRLQAAQSLDEVVAAAAVDNTVGGDVTWDVAALRTQVFVAETGEAAAKKALAQEVFRRENAEAIAKSVTAELEEVRRRLKLTKELSDRYLLDATELAAVVERHTEDYRRLENRVRAADDLSKRLGNQLKREREEFLACVAMHASQSRRLHEFLARADAPDGSRLSHVRQRNEELRERVRRLTLANRTLRARVNLRGMDPDVLTLAVEGLSTGELDWRLLELCEETRDALRETLDAADPLDRGDVLADRLARVAYNTAPLDSAVSPEAREAFENRTSPGTSRQEVRERVRGQVPQAVAAPSSRKRPHRGSRVNYGEDTGSENVDASSPPGGKRKKKRSRLSCSPSNSKKGAQKTRSRSRSKSSSSGSPAKLSGTPSSSPPPRRARSQSAPRLSPGEAPEESPTIETLAPGADLQCNSAGESSSTLVLSESEDEGGGASEHLPETGPLRVASSEVPVEFVIDAAESGTVHAVSLAPADVVIAGGGPSPAASSSGSVQSAVDRRQVTDVSADNAVVLSTPTTSQPAGVSESATDQVRTGARDAAPKAQSRRRPSRRRKSEVPPAPALMPSGNELRILSGAELIARYPKTVIKWAQPYIEPKFRSRGAAVCWNWILNRRMPLPVNSKASVGCTLPGLAAFTNFSDPRHPWQRVRRQLPPQAYFFDTRDFDPNSYVSQRAPIPRRLCSYWRQLRGYGKDTEAGIGIALWERDHWVPASAVERCFRNIRRLIAESKYSAAKKAQYNATLDLAIAAWEDYDENRCRRGDNLRVKLVKTAWEWAVDEDNPDVKPELLIEPSLPGYSFEYLNWIPKTTDWLAEIPDLDAREPWRNGWIDAPEQHPYNTTFVPCNPGADLFVPVGFSPESIVRRIQVNPSLKPGEISPGWASAFDKQGSSGAEAEASQEIPDLPTDPLPIRQVAVAEDPGFLQILAMAAAAAADAED